MIKSSLRFFDDVRHILLAEWDPIGIRDEPAAEDEYDAYATEIVSLIERGATAAQIADRLLQIEGDVLGIAPDRARAGNRSRLRALR